MTGQLLQFGGSLAAILALAAMAHWLGLGRDTAIRDDDHLRELLDDALDGFVPAKLVTARDGLAALAQDADGRIILLRRHGARFASRLLDRSTLVQRDGDKLTVTTPDRRFGAVTLDLGDAAPAWAERLAAL